MRYKSRARKDLSNWLIHFVHDSTKKHLPSDIPVDHIPDLLSTMQGDNDEDCLCSTNLGIQPPEEFIKERSALEVLKKILRDGFIKSTWSFRNERATVYGFKSTVCFTEMPLYALLNYAKNRNRSDAVSCYSIAFIRDELFNAKVRPVIYGLTGKHQEEYDGYYLRLLDEECGIGINEQYRYVAFNLDRSYPIDWTHEREWRWGGLEEYGVPADVPGFPLFESEADYCFSKILITVNTNNEAEEIIEELRLLYDLESNNSYEINTRTIENTRVLSLESLDNFDVSNEDVSFDQLPLHKLPKLNFVESDDSRLPDIEQAIEEAQKIYAQTSKRVISQVSSNDQLLCGYGLVVTADSNTPLTRTLVENEIALFDALSSKYILWGIDRSNTQSAEVNYLSALKAAEYLTNVLGQKFDAIKRYN